MQASDTRQEAKEHRASIVLQASDTGWSESFPDRWLRNPTDAGTEASPCGGGERYSGSSSAAENQRY